MLRGVLRRRHDRDILVLALPALGALAADPLVSLVDTAFVGRLGALELAALGVNTAAFGFVFVAFNFLAYGTTPMIARAVGRGDPAAAARVVGQALTLALAVGAVALAGLELLAVPLLRAMGAGEELLPPALSYLRIRALAGPAVLLITAGNGAFRGYQDTRTPLWITLALNLVNVVLDALFIFGFGWGLVGAAWATTIAQWLGAGLFWGLLLGGRRGAARVHLERPRLQALAPFLRIGWALLVRTAALLGTLTAATAVAARVGVTEVAAHQVAAQLWLLLALVVDALAIAAQALVARHVGAGDAATAREVSDRLLLLGLAVGALLGVGFGLARGWLPALFSDDEAVRAAVRSVIPFVALMQPLNALAFVWDGVFMGIEDFGFLARAMLVSAAAAAVPLALVLPLDWGLAGVWWAIVALMVARALTLAWRYWAASPFRRAAA